MQRLSRRKFLGWSLGAGTTLALPWPRGKRILPALPQAPLLEHELTAWIGGEKLGDVRVMTVSVTQNMIPIGDPYDARPQFLRGKTEIAGTIVFDAIDGSRLRSQASPQLPFFDVQYHRQGERRYVLRDVCLVNEGWGDAPDDVMSERAFTWVARAFEGKVPPGRLVLRGTPGPGVVRGGVIRCS